MPVPREHPSSAHPGPVYGGGGTYYGGDRYRDDYWGGCYYLDGRYYYWGGYYYSPLGDRYGRYPFDQDYPTGYAYPPKPHNDGLPIFFPPDPPPLGSPVPPPPPQQPYLTAPDELANFVAAPFYAPLSSRLAKRNLTQALRKRLDTYAASKAVLESELQSRLASVAALKPSVRLRDLEAFSQQQTPRIAALERESEQLRVGMLRGGLVGTLWGSGDWNEKREWRLSVGRFAIHDAGTLRLAFQVFRAAAFYQEGLSPAQRRLVRELVMEAQVEAFQPAAARSEKSSDDALIFFSPDGARVRLPVDLGTELAAEVAAYTQEKSALKAELRDMLVREDAATPAHRTAALRKLASAQAPRIQVLEEKAEQIRRDLATKQGESGALTQLPPELSTRLVTWHQDWRAIQDALASKLSDINRSYGFEAVSFIRDPDDFASTITLRTQIRPSAKSAEIKYRIQATVAAFNRESAERKISLNREAEALRRDIAAYAADHPQALAGRAVDDWWKSTMTALQRDDIPAQYRDYRTAVFEPGLSPEQRRLLFDAALCDLRLPLPGGELQP